MGKWGSGEVGKWGSGEVGKWGSGVGKGVEPKTNFASFHPFPSFFYEYGA